MWFLRTSTMLFGATALLLSGCVTSTSNLTNSQSAFVFCNNQGFYGDWYQSGAAYKSTACGWDSSGDSSYFSVRGRSTQAQANADALANCRREYPYCELVGVGSQQTQWAFDKAAEVRAANASAFLTGFGQALSGFGGGGGYGDCNWATGACATR